MLPPPQPPPSQTQTQPPGAAAATALAGPGASVAPARRPLVSVTSLGSASSITGASQPLLDPVEGLTALLADATEDWNPAGARAEQVAVKESTGIRGLAMSRMCTVLREATWPTPTPLHTVFYHQPPTVLPPCSGPACVCCQAGLTPRAPWWAAVWLCVCRSFTPRCPTSPHTGSRWGGGRGCVLWCDELVARICESGGLLRSVPLIPCGSGRNRHASYVCIAASAPVPPCLCLSASRPLCHCASASACVPLCACRRAGRGW